MNRIKIARENKGYNQKQLALEVGVSPPTISEWENEHKRPSGKRFEKLGRVLDVSVDYLLGVTDDPTPYHQINKDIVDAVDRGLISVISRIAKKSKQCSDFDQKSIVEFLRNLELLIDDKINNMDFEFLFEGPLDAFIGTSKIIHDCLAEKKYTKIDCLVMYEAYVKTRIEADVNFKITIESIANYIRLSK